MLKIGDRKSFTRKTLLSKMKKIFFLFTLLLTINFLTGAEKEEIKAIYDVMISHNKKLIAVSAESKHQTSEYFGLWYINIQNKNLSKIDDIGAKCLIKNLIEIESMPHVRNLYENVPPLVR